MNRDLSVVFMDTPATRANPKPPARGWYIAAYPGEHIVAGPWPSAKRAEDALRRMSRTPA